MLTKVFKYDMKSLKNTILTMLVVLLSLGLVGFGVRMLIYRSESGGGGAYFSSLGLFGLWILTLIGIVGIAATAGILILYRYYKSIFTDEGYLTMTLPVGTHSLLLGKMFAALLCGAVVALVAFFSYFLVVALPEILYLIETGIFESILDSFENFNIFDIFGDGTPTVILGMTDIFFSVIKEFVLLYAAVTVGATVCKKAKLVGAVLFVFLASFLNAILSALFTLISYVRESAALSYSLNILLSIAVIALAYYLTYDLLHKRFNIE